MHPSNKAALLKARSTYRKARNNMRLTQGAYEYARHVAARCNKWYNLDACKLALDAYKVAVDTYLIAGDTLVLIERMVENDTWGQ